MNNDLFELKLSKVNFRIIILLLDVFVFDKYAKNYSIRINM